MSIMTYEQLIGEFAYLEMEDSFPTLKVVDMWNELPEEVVEVGIVTTFKMRGWKRFGGIWDKLIWSVGTHYVHVPCFRAV